MQVGQRSHIYRWIENWITIPDSPSARENGRTHGLAVTPEQDVVVFHQAHDAVLIYSPDGELKSKWGGDRFPGAHGLTLVVDPDGRPYLWLADEKTHEVVKTTLDGDEVMTLDKPDHPAYSNGKYVPTWVAVNEERHGGNGDVWIADGYGSSLVHHFDKSGKYLESLDGEAGAGRFACPHGILFDPRKASSPELYVADRGNQRVQVFDGEGRFKRVFGGDGKSMDSPCGFVFDDTHCYFPELHGALAVFDENDKLVTFLGENDKIHCRGDWPGKLMTGYPNERDHVREGVCNAPHGMAVNDRGDLYYGEWITGGRVCKLERQ